MALCLLEHINLGACELSDIPQAFVKGMDELCDLHPTTGVETGEYLTPSMDRQVGLGMLGLANLLALEGFPMLNSLMHWTITIKIPMTLW